MSKEKNINIDELEAKRQRVVAKSANPKKDKQGQCNFSVPCALKIKPISSRLASRAANNVMPRSPGSLEQIYRAETKHLHHNYHRYNVTMITIRNRSEE